MYNSNLEYLDGMILNKNIPFSMDNMPSDMSVYANYKSYTPYVNAIKEVSIKFLGLLGLDEGAGQIAVIGGAYKVMKSVGLLNESVSFARELVEKSPVKQLFQTEDIVKLVKMTDTVYIPENTLVLWVKEAKTGAPSIWSMPNNHGVIGTINGNLQIEQRDSFVKLNKYFGEEVFKIPELMLTTAKEFMGQMKKFYGDKIYY